MQQPHQHLRPSPLEEDHSFRSEVDHNLGRNETIGCARLQSREKAKGSVNKFQLNLLELNLEQYFGFELSIMCLVLKMVNSFLILY